MREILFRGQTRKYGQKVNMAGEKLPGIWVYGGIFPGTGDHSIIYGGPQLSGLDIEKHVVYSDTVGQFTGLKDKHGTRIFEGDVLRFMAYGYEYTALVEFRDGLFRARCRFPEKIDRIVFGYKPEIVGNIHDNPELLEV